MHMPFPVPVLVMPFPVLVLVVPFPVPALQVLQMHSPEYVSPACDFSTTVSLWGCSGRNA